VSVFKPKFRILMIKKTGMIIRPRSAPRPIILVLALGVFIAVAAAILTGSNLIAVVMAQNSVVDIRLSPASSTVGQGATTTIDILVEPNGQETTGVQVFIDFTPSHLQVSQIITDPNSPLDVVIQAPDFDNSAGTIGLSYGTFATGPTTSFTLAIITFVSKVVDLDTKVAFSTVSPRKTIASIEGSEIQDELAGSTISILAGVSLTGQVLLQGGSRTDSGWQVPVTVTLFAPGADPLGDTPILTYTTTTSKVGSVAEFSVPGVPLRTYDIAVSSEHTLMNIKRDVAVSDLGIVVDLGTLLEGDSNGDGFINILDFTLLASTYLKGEGDGGYAGEADFDRSGLVDVLDFTLLAGNFLRSSPILVPTATPTPTPPPGSVPFFSRVNLLEMESPTNIPNDLVLAEVQELNFLYQSGAKEGVTPPCVEGGGDRSMYPWIFMPPFQMASIEKNFALRQGFATGYSISDNGFTYLLHINPDAIFQDGTPITAQSI